MIHDLLLPRILGANLVQLDELNTLLKIKHSQVS